MACVCRSRGQLLALRVVLDVVHAGDRRHKALNGVLGGCLIRGTRSRTDNATAASTPHSAPPSFGAA